MKTLMLLFAAGKFGKFLISGGSMLIAIGTYTIIYGWKYAVGFVLLLLVHELGHYMSLSGVLCLRHTMRSDRRQYAQASKEDAESQRSRARGGIAQDPA